MRARQLLVSLPVLLLLALPNVRADIDIPTYIRNSTESRERADAELKKLEAERDAQKKEIERLKEVVRNIERERKEAGTGRSFGPFRITKSLKAAEDGGYTDRITTARAEVDKAEDKLDTIKTDFRKAQLDQKTSDATVKVLTKIQTENEERARKAEEKAEKERLKADEKSRKEAEKLDKEAREAREKAAEANRKRIDKLEEDLKRAKVGDRVDELKHRLDDDAETISHLERVWDQGLIALYLREKLEKLANGNELCEAANQCEAGKRKADAKKVNVDRLFTHGSGSSSGGSSSGGSN